MDKFHNFVILLNSGLILIFGLPYKTSKAWLILKASNKLKVYIVMCCEVSCLMFSRHRLFLISEFLPSRSAAGGDAPTRHF